MLNLRVGESQCHCALLSHEISDIAFATILILATSTLLSNYLGFIFFYTFHQLGPNFVSGTYTPAVGIYIFFYNFEVPPIEPW